MDAAARRAPCGTENGGALLRVHAPLLAPDAAAATLLVFVDVEELPATLVRVNFDTLATRTYTLAQDERLAEAALPSTLAVVAVGVLPLLVLAARRRAAPHSPKARTAAPDRCARLRVSSHTQCRIGSAGFMTIDCTAQAYFQPAQ